MIRGTIDHPLRPEGLRTLASDAEVGAERCLNPLHRRAYKHLADAAWALALTIAEDEREP